MNDEEHPLSLQLPRPELCSLKRITSGSSRRDLQKQRSRSRSFGSNQAGPVIVISQNQQHLRSTGKGTSTTVSNRTGNPLSSSLNDRHAQHNDGDRHGCVSSNGGRSIVKELDLDACSSVAALLLDSSITKKPHENKEKRRTSQPSCLSNVTRRISLKSPTTICHQHRRRSSSSNNSNDCSNSSKVRTYILKGQWSKLRDHLETSEGMKDLQTQASSSSGITATSPDLMRRPSTVSTVAVCHNNAPRRSSSFSSGCSTSTTNKISDPTLLHMACQKHPPLDIIAMLCEAQPSWLVDRNNTQQHTPLHVACKWGAHPSVVDYFLQHNPEHAAQHDTHRRTPLHLHCEFCAGRPNTCDPFSFVLTGGCCIEEEVNCLLTRRLRKKGRSSKSKNKSINHPITDSTIMKEEDSDPGNMDFALILQHTTSIGKPLMGPIPMVIDLLYQAAPRTINQSDDRGQSPVDYCCRSSQEVRPQQDDNDDAKAVVEDKTSPLVVHYLMQLSEQQYWKEHE